jgi:DNA-binding NarL/FixJ family response regulator
MLLVQGVSHCNIAAKVYMTEGIVKNPVWHILARLQAEYHTRAADLTRRYGLV